MREVEASARARGIFGDFMPSDLEKVARDGISKGT